MAEPEAADIEARIDERGDLVDRIDQGDALAVVELLEHVTGATAQTLKVTLPRPTSPAAGG